MSKFSLSKVLAQNIALPAHKSLVNSRRVRRLSELIAGLLPEENLKGLDIGCGSGEIAKCVQDLHKSALLEGTDLLVRPNTAIPVFQSSGEKLPFDDKSYDFAMLIDVLHHTDDPKLVLSEALRVSRKFVIVKDHYKNSEFDRFCLLFMDWVGNRAHDVPLPANYLSPAEWQKLQLDCGLKVQTEIEQLSLYNQPLSALFDRQLHFISKLERI